MKEQEKKPARFDDIIDRYRWYIGAFLLFLVIISGGYLLWRERGREVAGKHQVAGLEELNNKIRSMEAKTLQLEEKIISLGKTKCSRNCRCVCRTGGSSRSIHIKSNLY